MNKMPDRWLPYKPVGDVISGTRFIAFKVPLNKRFFHDERRNIASEDHFTPQILLDVVQDLGMIIDLTATTRYYNPREFEDNEVQYVKIFTQGHQVPSCDVISKFTTAVQTFLERNGHNDKKIGVHCTHGVNRTGYLICRYMIEQMKMQSKDAIERFGTSRGHPIERENYLQSLNSLRFTVDTRESRNKGETCDQLQRGRDREFRNKRHNGASVHNRPLNGRGPREVSRFTDRGAELSTNWRIPRVSRVTDRSRSREPHRSNDRPRIYDSPRNDEDQGNRNPSVSRDRSVNRNCVSSHNNDRRQNDGNSYRPMGDGVPQAHVSSLHAPRNADQYCREPHRSNDRPRIYDNPRNDEDQGNRNPSVSRDRSVNRNCVSSHNNDRRQNDGNSYRPISDGVPQAHVSSLQEPRNADRYCRTARKPRNKNKTNSMASSSVSRQPPKHDR